MLSARINKFEVKKIKDAFERASKRPDLINLAIGYPDADVPEIIKKEAIKAIKDGFNTYTSASGIEELKEAVLKKVHEKNGISASLDNILITSGVSGGLFIALYALLDTEDEVLIFDPYFVIYKELPNLIGIQVNFVDTYPNFLPDPEKIEKAISKNTKVLIINSPSNPTGVVYPRKVIEQIALLAKKHNLIVISDEIYEDFVFEGEHFSIGSIYENTITLLGFAKSYAAPGWRVGYAVGPTQIIEAMEMLQQYIYVCPPSPLQKALIKAFETNPRDIVSAHNERRELVLSKLSEKFKIHGGHGSFFLFPQIKGLTGEEFTERALEKGVLVLPGNVFSQKDINFRLSYACPPKSLSDGIEILNQLLN